MDGLSYLKKHGRTQVKTLNFVATSSDNEQLQRIHHFFPLAFLACCFLYNKLDAWEVQAAKTSAKLWCQRFAARQKNFKLRTDVCGGVRAVH